MCLARVSLLLVVATLSICQSAAGQTLRPAKKAKKGAVASATPAYVSQQPTPSVTQVPHAKTADSENGAAFAFLLVLAGVIVGCIVLKKKQHDKHQEFLKRIGAVEEFSVGTYLTGLPQVDKSGLNLSCAVTENDFVFVSGDNAVSGIARDSINQIMVDDKSHSTFQLSATERQE